MKRPCIRGLKEYKKGCPEKHWDGSSGCPAWKEYTIPQEGGKPAVIRDCVDILREHWAFESLKLLEGNQQAIESFRNGMIHEVDGKSQPKTGLALMALAGQLKRLE